MATPFLAYSYFFDTNGNPLSGGKVYTYEAGTTSDRATYTDESKATANSNPVVLDSDGKEAIYLDGIYNIVVTDADDVTVWTKDNVSAIGQNEWLGEYPATMASFTSVSVAGDVTSVFTAKRAVKIADSSTVYGHVTSSSYLTGYTTVELSLDSALTAAVSGIAAAVVSSNSLPSLTEQVVVFGGAQHSGRGACGFVVSGLTGGTDDNLDGIDGATGSANGGPLLDNDIAFHLDGDNVAVYEMDADSGEVESSPTIIEPNNSPGTRRWKLRFYKWLKAAVNIGGFTNSGDLTNSTGNVIFSADGKGVQFSDGSIMYRHAAEGIRIVPADDVFANAPRIRNAVNDGDVLVLSPSSNDTALAGLSTNQPITPANLKYVLQQSGMELQKVVASLGGVESTTTSTSWQTASGHTAAITTKKASSKILIELTTTANLGPNAIVSFRREVSGGSSTNNITGYTYGIGKIFGSGGYGGAVATVRYLDTPDLAVGTAVTYKLNFRSESGSSTQVGDSATVSTMTLTEIA